MIRSWSQLFKLYLWLAQIFLIPKIGSSFWCIMQLLLFRACSFWNQNQLWSTLFTWLCFASLMCCSSFLLLRLKNFSVKSIISGAWIMKTACLTSCVSLWNVILFVNIVGLIFGITWVKILTMCLRMLLSCLPYGMSCLEYLYRKCSGLTTILPIALKSELMRLSFVVICVYVGWLEIDFDRCS